ncbi:radical SAM family heme chaperone HemW [uncultured Cytophaga sp.]|uniref:radical SAM family heme chaperone HemW n=1 Tax=uncultured Cytophaga sp. TaxID=160238 RepID=UPI0026247B6B|nr:radical SAM family heme chaperone HemW [uncultured Cytophaga sp.]
MSGIYIHIPYCHKACNYCNFHFSTSLKSIDSMIDALCKELAFKKDYLEGDIIETIYFGGGTPSILNQKQLELLFLSIHESYVVSDNAEITIEANPEDINEALLGSWNNMGINRLSIGIQSFQDHYLQWMNRNHSSGEAINSVYLAQKNGFKNISIDLIYGLPNLSLEQWKEEINTAINLNVTHISTYCLTIEERTALGKLVEKGTVQLISEDEVEKQMLHLMNTLGSVGFEQYEISNFCKPGFESKHNSSYWKHTSYIGIGPGAHSYNKKNRQHNIANNALYIKNIRADNFDLNTTTEELSETDRYNEYILTRIRTKWGINAMELNKLLPTNSDALISTVNTLCANEFLYLQDNFYKLTQKGRLLADEITLKLMV